MSINANVVVFKIAEESRKNCAQHKVQRETDKS
jgi:hypothetical protein